MAPSSGQICNKCKRSMLLLNLIQVTESISGSVVPLAMFNQLKGLLVMCTTRKTIFPACECVFMRRQFSKKLNSAPLSFERVAISSAWCGRVWGLKYVLCEYVHTKIFVWNSMVVIIWYCNTTVEHSMGALWALWMGSYAAFYGTILLSSQSPHSPWEIYVNY